jgi:hypothetical protein
MNDDRKIIINIPDGLDLPVFMESFTSQENLYMLLVGSYATYTLRGGNIGFLERDPDEYKAIRKEFEDIIKNKDIATNAIKNTFEELLDREQEKRCDKVQTEIEREKYKLNIETIKYQEKIEQLQEKINEIEKDNIKKQELINHTAKELENEVAVRTQQKELFFIQEINKIKEKENEKNSNLQEELTQIKLQMNNNLIETEKEKNTILQVSIQEMTQIMQEVKNQTNKTNTRGKDGEAYFFELAKNTFSEYDGFEIIDKSKTPHSGDFNLIFDRFTIMVDSKCFIDTDVPIRDRKKLKYDMTQNSHIKIAWMVSMHRQILKFSKYPFMIEIDDGICVIYINSLMESDNPANLLKLAWHTSCIIFDLLNQDDDSLLLSKYKKNDIRVREIMDKMMRKSRERYATLKQLKDNFDDTERDIKDVLNTELFNIQNNQEELIKKWWKENLAKYEKGKIKTNILYNLFCECEENKKHCISIDIFKQIIQGMLNENEIVVGKTKSYHTILNYKIIPRN